MKTFNFSLAFGGGFGFLSIAIAAYATHVLKIKITNDHFDNVMRAIHYQQLHAAMMAIIGIARFLPLPAVLLRRVRLASFLYAIGIVLFCGGIYASALMGVHAALNVVPAGGFAFMLGWLILASAGFIPRPESGRGT